MCNIVYINSLGVHYRNVLIICKMLKIVSVQNTIILGSVADYLFALFSHISEENKFLYHFR